MELDQMFELGPELGVGTFGRVFSARPFQPKDFNNQERIAIKIISFSEDIRRKKYEVDIMKDCKSNFIVSFFDSYESEGAHISTLWIAMELCEPGSIADVMRMTKSTLNEPELQFVSASVMLGLLYLHQQNIIHRDIKAGNILLTRNGTIKIADFGVSAQMSTNKPYQRTVIGAPYWMAPEVISGSEDYDCKADIWSMGISLIEMAEGRPPHHETPPTRVIFFIPSKAAPALQPGHHFSADMVDFVTRCLIKEPGLRNTSEQNIAHPFIAKACTLLSSGDGSCSVLLGLVNKCLPVMEKYRSSSHAAEVENQHSNEFEGGNAPYDERSFIQKDGEE